ncbi:MAG: hypothetical protein MJ099_05515 [Clostridia bacterium]|nr:hypothetical protein [Clostridia bacterium]
MAIQKKRPVAQAKKTVHRKTNRNTKAILRGILAAVTLVVLPPLGVFLTWRTRWSNMVKMCLTGAAVVVLAIGVALLPSAGSGKVGGGVTLVGTEQEAEIYGPALPTAMVTGYTALSTDAIFTDDTQSEVHYVYAAEGARCYHEYECKFAYASSMRLTLYEAYYLGYTPCGRCKPPVYQP